LIRRGRKKEGNNKKRNEMRILVIKEIHFIDFFKEVEGKF